MARDLRMYIRPPRKSVIRITTADPELILNTPCVSPALSADDAVCIRIGHDRPADFIIITQALCLKPRDKD